MGIIQANRVMGIKTPLEDDVLLLKGMSGNEQISGLFEFEVDLVSETSEIDFNKIIGDKMTISFTMTNEDIRYFNGFVSSFSQTGFVGSMATFRATLVPWLWFLTQKADCRIFQGKTVPDIIKEIFRDHGFSDFEESLTEDYRTWDYCVQYGETDFNFVSRLMEQEGIYYYFRQEEDKHTLILSDSYSSHELMEGYKEVPFFPPDENALRERDHISEWNVTRQVRPGLFVHNDFDFKKPKKSLKAESAKEREHSGSSYEIFQYPGEYKENTHGDAYAKIRLEELQSGFEIIQAEGNVQGVFPGGLFALTKLPREDQNKEYLVLSSSYQLNSDPFGSSDSSDYQELVFYCSFSAIDSQEPYRPPRVTPKPFIQGPQTAIVVGKDKEEIWTDKYGRVKVQFHWDRKGEGNEKSSCWIRVAQLWAGSGWGGIHIPRIGQEVIVEFLEGDPDQPIITGRVYNGDRMPPYELPTEATKSGIKSHSSKEGGADNFNEIRFEDKKGEEELNVQAEKDTTILTKNDKNQSTGNNETLSVGKDRTKDVGNNETSSISKNRTESVGKDETISIGSNRTESVGENETVSVGKNESLSVGENRDVSVGKNQSINVGKNETISVGKNCDINIGENETITIGKNSELSIGKDRVVQIEKNLTIKAKKISITAEDELQIKVGKSSLIMKKDGKIEIEGKDINIKGSGNIKMKGKKIAQN